MTTVSVVIPTYNRAHLLDETVRSVLAQTHAPHEVIIVDDGSTDDTEALCAGYPEPVRYIKQANTGLPGARNTGIRAATGDYVALVDSDDLWDPRKLEIQLAALEEHPEAGWSISECALIGPASEPWPSAGTGFEYVFPVFRQLGMSPDAHFSSRLEGAMLEMGGEAVRLYTGDAFELLFRGNFALPSSAMVRRAEFDRVGLFDADFRWAEDTEFFHRMSATSPLVIVMAPLTLYRVGQQSMITGSDPTPFVRYALVSLDRAAALRRLSPAEERAYRAGKRALGVKLAYVRLSLLDPEGARAALRQTLRGDPHLSLRILGIGAATLLPSPVLRGLHRIKRRAAGARAHAVS